MSLNLQVGSYILIVNCELVRRIFGTNNSSNSTERIWSTRELEGKLYCVRRVVIRRRSRERSRVEQGQRSRACAMEAHQGPPGPEGLQISCEVVRAVPRGKLDASLAEPEFIDSVFGTGPGRSRSGLPVARRPSALAAAAAAASCVLLVVTMSALHRPHAPVELLETQEMGIGYMQQAARDFAAPSAQQQEAYYSQQPELYADGQQLAMQPPGTSLSNPAGAPTYNTGEGMTYMPSTQSGVSAADQSPDLPVSFLDDEDKSKKRMKKLAKMLKTSAKEQDALDLKVRQLDEYVKGEETAIRNDVLQVNEQDSDMIAAPYHLVEGPR
jgi:hypothetical protein